MGKPSAKCGVMSSLALHRVAGMQVQGGMWPELGQGLVAALGLNLLFAHFGML